MTGKILQTLYPELEPEELIKIILIDDNGLIVLITDDLKKRPSARHRVLVYKCSLLFNALI